MAKLEQYLQKKNPPPATASSHTLPHLSAVISASLPRLFYITITDNHSPNFRVRKACFAQLTIRYNTI